MWREGRESIWVLWAKSLRMLQDRGCVSAGSAGMFYTGFLWSSWSSLWPAGDLSNPLCATGQLMCRLMSCFTVPTVWHQHAFFISVNCSDLISDRDVNIHLRWSYHSWSAKIDCHLHLVVVRISNVSPLTARDQILMNGGSYFRSQILLFKSLGSLKKWLMVDRYIANADIIGW